MAGKYFWIKERENPQLGTYYVACGQITIKEAQGYERKSLYGFNIMHKYATKEAYGAELSRLKESGKENEMELRKRLLAKTERDRIKRSARRKFLRKNPKWEENLRRSKHFAELRRHVNETRFRGMFQKREKRGILKSLFMKVKSLFQRKV